jgi:hypothetical protein
VPSGCKTLSRLKSAWIFSACFPPISLNDIIFVFTISYNDIEYKQLPEKEKRAVTSKGIS